jgi:hypothetical protein
VEADETWSGMLIEPSPRCGGRLFRESNAQSVPTAQAKSQV